MTSIKHLIKSCKPLYNTYRYLKAQQTKRRITKGEKYFAENSAETLNKIQTILENSEWKFYFAFGTILGIIRDNRLLERDMDIDMIVYCKGQEDIEKCKQYLCAHGMEPVFEFSVDGIGVVQHAFDFNKIRVDINYCTASDNDPVDYVYVLFDEDGECNKVARFACTHSTVTRKHNFNGIYISSPEDPIAFIENMYGANWRIPDKDYKYWRSPCVDVLEEQGHTYKFKKRFWGNN